jgi:hypothetical protein
MAPKNRVSRSHVSPSGEAAGVAGEVPLAGLAAGCGAAPSVLSNNKMQTWVGAAREVCDA